MRGGSFAPIEDNVQPLGGIDLWSIHLPEIPWNIEDFRLDQAVELQYSLVFLTLKRIVSADSGL